MIWAMSEGQRYRTRISNGSEAAFADATPDKGGAGAGFRPHELLEAALAACVNMSVRMVADRRAIPLESVTTRVHLERGPEGAVFHTEVELVGDSLTPKQREMLMQAAQACPVRRTLSGPLRVAE